MDDSESEPMSDMRNDYKALVESLKAENVKLRERVKELEEAPLGLSGLVQTQKKAAEADKLRAQVERLQLHLSGTVESEIKSGNEIAGLRADLAEEMKVSAARKTMADNWAEKYEAEFKLRREVGAELASTVLQVSELTDARDYWQRRTMEQLKRVDEKQKAWDAATRQKNELLEAAGLAIEEFGKLNPYDRRDVRFLSRAEAALRKAVEACTETPKDGPPTKNCKRCYTAFVCEDGSELCGVCTSLSAEKPKCDFKNCGKPMPCSDHWTKEQAEALIQEVGFKRVEASPKCDHSGIYMDNDGVYHCAVCHQGLT